MDVLEVLANSGALVPVLVLTGLDPDEVEMPALRSGVQQFLKKPVRKPALLRAVAKLLATSDNAAEGWSPRSGGNFDWQSNHAVGHYRRCRRRTRHPGSARS
ncbi:MAG: response regulator [Candidatus Binatia bacterium]|nr:response regulator [Candidatus Binatia bacterium]